MIAEREREFAASLAASGMRMTHQRLEIIRELAAADDHPDAELVFRRVRERVPTLAHDTVYRALAVLVTQGLVERIAMPRATRFDPDRTVHHHFVCDRCGRLLDLSPELVPAALPGVGRVRSVNLELWGVCDACGT
jgi:Fur family peroxide stress response transcriptional regulator